MRRDKYKLGQSLRSVQITKSNACATCHSGLEKGTSVWRGVDGPVNPHPDVGLLTSSIKTDKSMRNIIADEFLSTGLLSVPNAASTCTNSMEGKLYLATHEGEIICFSLETLEVSDLVMLHGDAAKLISTPLLNNT